ncbi:MAG: hypothetical protein V5A38_00615 [Halolamina sp.]|uniref:hypothetical protein n=1 Tax=Halolamina sp. TaxID=1940283 RepID=UPI002FC2B46C
MGPVSGATFARLFDRLDTQAKREFVADLYAARGVDVKMDDGQLQVSQDGETRRIAILEPPRLRSVSLPDVDEVVVTRDHGGVRSTAEAAGVDYRTPADLCDLLLYGLDREQAAVLFTEYFDQPLSVVVLEDDAADSGLNLAALWPSFDWNARQAVLVAILLIGIAVWAVGVGLPPTLDSDAASPELNVTYTPGAAGAIGGNQEYPPGLGPDGIENAGELTVAHFEFLDGQSHAYRIAASGPQHAPFMLGLTQWNATVQIQNWVHYRYQKQEVAPYGFRVEQREDNLTVWDPKRQVDVGNNSSRAMLTKQVYANGSQKFWRFDGPEQLVYRRASVEQQGGRILGVSDQVGWVDLYLQRFLWTPNSSVSCASTSETQDCQTFRVEATGDPIELRTDVIDYRAVAFVDQRGFVRSLRVRYKIDPLEEGEPVPVRFHLEYLDVGEGSGSVSPPEWLDTAKNRTTDDAAEQTETPTETANETSLPPG